MCVRSGARWVHCGPCRPRLSLSSVWESKASKFLRMPLVKVALLYSFLTVDKSNEKTWDHIQPCISPIISAFWPFPVCGTQQRQQKKKKRQLSTHTVKWHTLSGALLLCVTCIEWKYEWRVCIRVGGCAAVRLALWHRGGGCVRIWWSLLGCFFLFVCLFSSLREMRS